MIKKLYEENILNIEQILIKEYKNLNLEITELIILLFLFKNYKKKIFSSLELAEETNFSKNETEFILEKLIKKKFFSLSQKKKDDKIIEIFDLDGVFKKIEQIYLKKEHKKNQNKKNHLISETIENLEKLKEKLLLPYEYEIVKSWYKEKKYLHEDIIETIKQASFKNNYSITYIERILNQKKNNSKIEKDDKADKILHEIFKKIR
ncbi:DnaD domain protein [Candidatus Phytoplasma pini]|uniref:DNA replication protein n=1 Tax=Candidatus Phytoplasma pini TaxID=267362 RepID=A0A559KJR5_9MOLU|nr:DnaD domain protein [Candidatus Phytoplasma pini]TVY12374.1 DNA replication protein [Candidatus Phytoplasma pini]